MAARSWLQPHLVAVLKDRLPVLAKWREQLPGLQGHVRNFENWVLVELNHQLLGSGFARCVLTNGFFAEGEDALSVKRVRSQDVVGLAGRSRAVYLSADLSVRRASGETLVAEIKTGLAGLELLDDVQRVRYYQGTVATRAEVGWVVILPNDLTRRRSAEKSFEKISQRLHQEANVRLDTKQIKDWLWSTVIVPTSDGPPNNRLQPAPASGIVSRRG